jgi:multidrug resistance efflux pump
MTALAFALVACCAMVCGTGIVLVRAVIEHRAAGRARDAAFQAAQDEVRAAVAEANAKWDAYRAKVETTAAEVASLRADMAVRSIA